MKQMSPGQHKASSTLMAYIQDVLDTENLNCSSSSALYFQL